MYKEGEGGGGIHPPAATPHLVPKIYTIMFMYYAIYAIGCMYARNAHVSAGIDNKHNVH
jgi:hypothetical protein